MLLIQELRYWPATWPFEASAKEDTISSKHLPMLSSQGLPLHSNGYVSLCAMQFNYASRHGAMQTRAAQKEAVKPAPAPAKEDKPKGVELKLQPGQLSPSAAHIRA